MSLRRTLWAFTSLGTLSISLWLLRFLGIIGSEVDILLNWLSIVVLVLFGVFMGITISEKKVSVKEAIINLLLVAILFPLSPIVGLTIAQALPFSRQQLPIAVGVFTSGFAFLYLGLLFWLRKKGFLKFTKINWTDQ
jgi:hypothetical protein